MSDKETVDQLVAHYKELKNEIHKVIVGQDDVVDQVLISIFSKGHCLLVGVPGLAKTLLVNTISDCLGLSFNRIQFTPDLMPSDIIGSEILDENRNFKFIKGPLFANIILADEINRTPPKTQAALLEAMQERMVTAAGTTYPLPQPFFVLATQNPIEQEGTYPLPEAQLDRFMFNIWVDYPSYEEELAIVKSTTSDDKVTLKQVISGEQIMQYQDLIRRIPVADNVLEYAVKLVGKTRINLHHLGCWTSCFAILDCWCKMSCSSQWKVLSRYRRRESGCKTDSSPPFGSKLSRRGRRIFYGQDHRRASLEQTSISFYTILASINDC